MTLITQMASDNDTSTTQSSAEHEIKRKYGNFYYDGPFADGKPNGMMRMYAKEIDKVSGYDGVEVMALRYKGYMVDGRRHGRGTQYYYMRRSFFGFSSLKKEYEGEWENGRYHGHGKYYSESAGNHLVYEGEFKKGRYANGTLYHKPDGLTAKKQVAYSGKIKDGEMHGPAKAYDIKGQKIKGTFYHGKLKGGFKMYQHKSSKKICDIEHINKKGIATGKFYDDDGELLFEGTRSVEIKYDDPFITEITIGPGYNEGTLYIRSGGTRLVGTFKGEKLLHGKVYDDDDECISVIVNYLPIAPDSSDTE